MGFNIVVRSRDIVAQSRDIVTTRLAHCGPPHFSVPHTVVLHAWHRVQALAERRLLVELKDMLAEGSDQAQEEQQH